MGRGSLCLESSDMKLLQGRVHPIPPSRGVICLILSKERGEGSKGVTFHRAQFIYITQTVCEIKYYCSASAGSKNFLKGAKLRFQGLRGGGNTRRKGGGGG